MTDLLFYPILVFFVFYYDVPAVLRLGIHVLIENLERKKKIIRLDIDERIILKWTLVLSCSP